MGDCNIVTRNLREHIVEYLEEIEKLSNVKISDVQRDKLIGYVGETKFSEIASWNPRNKFNDSKNEIKDEWVKNSSIKEWPSSVEKGYRKDFAAHHIIKLNFQGPNIWWNIVPIRYFSHDYLHNYDSHICYKIFECRERSYSFEDAKIRIYSIFNNSKEEELLKKINRDYKILTDAKCETIIEKYTKEIGYYLELSYKKGYMGLAGDIIKNYGNYYNLITGELINKLLGVIDDSDCMELIKKGGDNICEQADSILVSACKLKNKEIVDYILDMKKCPALNSIYNENKITFGDIGNYVKRTIFDYACTSGDIGIVESFIKKGATFEDIDITRRKSIFNDLKEAPIIQSRLINLQKKIIPDRESIRNIEKEIDKKWKYLFQKK